MSVKEIPESDFSLAPENLKIGVVVAEWNSKITQSLLEACVQVLKNFGFADSQIIIKWVPGSFELALGAQFLFEFNQVDGVACLGCIIKGETPHFHYISESTALTIGQLALKYNRPVSFGVITAETEAHAIDRAGGAKGNKGVEAATALLKMLKLKQDLREENRKNLGFI